MTWFREQGYAIDDEESEEGLFCLAAPVFNAQGQMAAAVSLAGPRERVLSGMEGKADYLLHAARCISQSIGYVRQE